MIFIASIEFVDNNAERDLSMDIKNLETFVMVNELKSFTQAAQRLGFTQSTVSFQIKQLENELGIPLFERISHTVTLTNEGQKLLPLAHQILRLWAEAGHIAGNTAPAGIVRIAIAESLSSWQFHSHFKDFHDRYPGIRLKLIAASTDDMFQMLGQNQVDIVYTLDRRIYSHHYMTALEAPVNIHFVTSPRHPLAKEKKVDIGKLLDYPLLLTEKNMSYRAILDEILAARGLETTPAMETGDTQLICSLLRQDIGISYLPEFVVQKDLANGRLVSLPVSDMPTPGIWRQLLYHRNKWISPEFTCVIDYLKEQQA